MSLLLKNLVKYSLFPASLMVISKLLGLIIAIRFFDLAFETYNGNGFFSFQILIIGSENTLLANSTADLVMLGTMTTISLLIFVRYFLFIQSERNPRTIVKLTKLNIVKWITSKESAFIKVFAWSLFLLATAALVTVNSLTGDTKPWIGGISFIIGLLNLWFLLRIFEFELSKVYPISNT